MTWITHTQWQAWAKKQEKATKVTSCTIQNHSRHLLIESSEGVFPVADNWRWEMKRIASELGEKP